MSRPLVSYLIIILFCMYVWVCDVAS